MELPLTNSRTMTMEEQPLLEKKRGDSYNHRVQVERDRSCVYTFHVKNAAGCEDVRRYLRLFQDQIHADKA